MERDAQVADCHNTVGACGTPGGTFARHIHKPEFVSGRSWNMLLFNIYSQQELETAFGNIADSCGGGGGLYGYLLYQMYVIVKESSNVFGSMMVIGVMVHLVCQIVINVSVATNVIPNTGVTLPFISSGGSALLMTMVECGMCIGIRRQQTRRVYQKHLNE